MSQSEDFRNRIYNCECVAGMRALPPDCIDLTVTSPPYDDEMDNGASKLRQYNSYIYDYRGIAQELYRVTKPGGVVVWVTNDGTVGGSETLASLEQALYFKQIGFRCHDTMIYEKAGFRFPDDDRYYSVFEYMFVFSKGAPKTVQLITDRKVKYDRSNGENQSRNKEGDLVKRPNYTSSKEWGVRYNVWRYNTVTGQNWDETRWHSAVFPIQLAIDHIVSWSKRGDTVLDPHSGSGTVAKAARMLGRHYIGYEISEEYYQKSLPNIEKYSFDEQLEIKTLNWNMRDQYFKAEEVDREEKLSALDW